MLVSKRRLQWTAITLLIMCLMLLFRPTRNWADRFLVARLVGPGITVSEIVIHRNKSIVEAREVRWSESLGDRQILLAAHRGWFAFDKLGLIDRHTRLPKIILQDAELHLDGAQVSPVVYVDRWKQRIAQQIVELDWEDVQQRFSCLLASRSLQRTWTDNIAHWVARSKQILAEAEELERQSIQLDNPLRFEFLLQEKLERIKQLSSEQQKLARQFDELEGQWKSEADRLQEVYRQDKLKLVGLVIGNVAIEELQNERQKISKELSEELGRAIWLSIAPYGEVMDRLATASQRAYHRPSYDVNIRSNQHGNEWLQISQWKAAGNFSYGDRQSLFRASGTWELTQEPFLPSSLAFQWHASFHREHAQVDVQVEHASQHSETLQLAMQVKKTALNTREIVALQPLELQASEPATSVRVSLTSQAGNFSGQLTIPRDALDCIESATLIPLLQFDSRPEAEPLQFDVSGPWTDVNLKLIGATPSWISQAVTAEAETRLKTAAEAATVHLDQAFAAELQQLTQFVATAVGDQKSLTNNHTRQLLATQDRLQQQLDDKDRTEFARRPGAIAR
jgi:hypothetical protein